VLLHRTGACPVRYERYLKRRLRVESRGCPVMEELAGLLDISEGGSFRTSRERAKVFLNVISHANACHMFTLLRYRQVDCMYFIK